MKYSIFIARMIFAFILLLGFSPKENFAQVPSNLVITNSGVWIPNAQVNSGSAIQIHNSLQGNVDFTANVRMEIRQVLSSGISSTPLVTQRFIKSKLYRGQIKRLC